MKIRVELSLQVLQVYRNTNQSTRNWDYRYCWLRDTYYTLTAFNNIGHFEELEKYVHFVENIISDQDERIQPLFTILGEKKIVEKEIDLDGYLGNKPVRIGNDAYAHIQNDVYGQVLASLLPLYIDKRFNHKAKKTQPFTCILSIEKN